MDTTVHRGGDMHMKRQTGFTLVELAVVVFLIGLLASLGLSALNAQMASAAISATKKKQDSIKDALITYLGQNKRLPCPAIPAEGTGLDSRDSSATAGNWDCKAEFGIVPYATLGLPKNAALDGWENFFSYAVSKRWTLTLNTTATPTAGGTTTNLADKAFNVGIPGAFTVNDRLPDATTPIISNHAVVFIVAHGKNWSGAFTSKGTQNAPPANGTDELANVPDKITWAVLAPFYQREYTDNVSAYGTHGAFDDVVLSLNENDLITPLVKDGALKSAEAQWVEQGSNIKSAVIGYMFAPSNAGSCAPPDISAFNNLLATNNIPSVDPWGGTINWTRNICRLNSDGSSRQYISGICSGTTTLSTSGFAFTITTTTPGATVNTPTIGQLISSYQNLLNNCP